MKEKLCLIAIFKNESHIIREWIQHYIDEGIQHFFLIDNNSTDNYQEKIIPFSNNIDLVKDDSIHQQPFIYNRHFKEKIQKFQWTIICDLDEFIYTRKNYKTIADFLNSIYDENITQIMIPWKVFGSNSFVNQPKSVIQNFTKRTNYDKKNGLQGVILEKNKKMGLCKYIVRTKNIEFLNIHNCKLKNGITITSDFKKTENHYFQDINEHILENANLHLNHYAIQSQNWFESVKMKRGSANLQISADAKSNIHYFYQFDHDSNDIHDTELKNKQYKK